MYVLRRRAEPRRRSVAAVLVAASSPVRACGVSVGMEERVVQAVAKDSSRRRLRCAVTGLAIAGGGLLAARPRKMNWTCGKTKAWGGLLIKTLYSI
ncbi:hypothetical protein PF001_g31254 [Phytophthora fragariae]|uniref:Uncharacterized protein n=1 Tax=Phytophthora fragariae TaxID=53985 RepID=A0A6A3DA35_9STRA|nr:hypothetical protein PF003_g8877 [Phytophthora fragariae]KAE8918289.1 hypothetical protein PF009_g31394 [Phytophthora fragariae]KAE9264492.1 hypothetical protein PF001_g31254 [Phytophthora fragariae]